MAMVLLDQSAHHWSSTHCSRRFPPDLPRHTEERSILTWKDTLQQLDLVGNVVSLPSLAALFLALSWAGVKYPWSDPRIITLFVVFAVLLIVFVIDQFVRGDSATLPPRIMQNRNVIAGFIFSFCNSSALAVLEYYLPIYYQVVLGYGPARSGYMMLPLLIGSMLAILLQGSGTSKFGYYTPFMISASILMPIAAGLTTTWTVGSSTAKLIVCFGLIGFAAGVGFMAPQTAVQTSLPADDAPLGLSVILFGQNFGPALCVALAQTIFTSRLSANLHKIAPNVDPTSIENMGLNEIKASFGAENLDRVLQGFSEALSQTWYLAVGLACMSLVGALLTDWKSVKEKES